MLKPSQKVKNTWMFTDLIQEKYTDYDFNKKREVMTGKRETKRGKKHNLTKKTWHDRKVNCGPLIPLFYKCRIYFVNINLLNNQHLKVCFSNKKYLITIQTHSTQIVKVYFLLKKTVFNGFLKRLLVQKNNYLALPRMGEVDRMT